MRSVVENLIAGVVVAGAVVVLFLGAAYGAMAIADWKCSLYGDHSSRPVEYVYWSGCYVTTDNGVFLIDQIRDVAP